MMRHLHAVCPVAVRKYSFAAARLVWHAGLCVALLTALAPFALTQDFGVKNLQGKVLGPGDAPVSGAIVYLQNSRNDDIKTFISVKDGSYQFADLSADTDYTVWARYKGKKSSTKTVSSLDSRKQVYLDLHIR